MNVLNSTSGERAPRIAKNIAVIAERLADELALFQERDMGDIEDELITTLSHLNVARNYLDALMAGTS